MLGNVDVSYCWCPQTVRAALEDFVTFIVQSYSFALHVITFCGAARVLKVMGQKTLVKGRWSYKVRIHVHCNCSKHLERLPGSSSQISRVFFNCHPPPPRATTFSLGSLLTSRKYPHSQKASWNDFRGAGWIRGVDFLGPLPSCVSIARSIPSCAYYFQAPVLHEA